MSATPTADDCTIEDPWERAERGLANWPTIVGKRDADQLIELGHLLIGMGRRARREDRR